MAAFSVGDRVWGTFNHQNTHTPTFIKGVVIEVLDEKRVMVESEKWGTIRMDVAQLDLVPGAAPSEG